VTVLLGLGTGLGGFTWAAYAIGIRNETRLDAVDERYTEIKRDIGAIRESQERAIWILTGKREAAPGAIGNGG